jgi:hypothetical protein
MSRITYVLAAAFLPLTALAQGPITPSAGEQMAQMQRNMDAMHEQMARIHATQDPQERQRLMHEHMQNMHQGMTMMGQMMGPMGQGGEAPRACAEGDIECRMRQMQMQQQMMSQRMGMMQQMMQQMIEQISAGQATEPAGPAETASPTAPGVPDAEAEDHAQHH